MSEHERYSIPDPAFPLLTPDNHRVIGPATDRYNCVAWACGESERWWQPGPYFFWPIDSDPDDLSMNCLIAALEAVGFSTCADGVVEDGFEKVAVFAGLRGEYTHVARLLPTGKWTSKLGVDPLIEHETVEAVSGGAYGSVAAFLKRPIRTS